jgi:uncharacterized protein YndB with AHSA1/START domain
MATTLHHLVPIKAPPEKVFAAIATQNGYRGWYTADSIVENKAGGKAEFGFDKRKMVFRMTIEKLEPGKSLVMSCHGDQPEWAGTTLEWTVEPAPEGSTLTFNHKGWREITPFCAGCNSMWGNLMFRLKAYVETGKPSPEWRE